jgi:RNA polymerase sigma-70 factor (ECF subfamily)
VHRPTVHPAAHETDRALAERATGGDAAALEEFTRRAAVVGSILAVRNRRMGAPLSDADLDDLTQDTIVVIWRKLGSYSGDGPLDAWFYRICALELLNAVRRRRRRARTASEPACEPWYVEDPGGSEASAVRLVLRHLADREAEVVLLKHFDQLSFSEIGTLLELATTTVKTHYYRGIDKLRVALSRTAREPEETLP